MATQAAIAKHLDLTQQAVSKMLKKLNLTGEDTLETIRVAYIRNLREQAAGHVSDAGLDLVQERAKTEIVERQLKRLELAEKTGELVNRADLHTELALLFTRLRDDVLSLGGKVKNEIDTLYGTDIDVNLIDDKAKDLLRAFARHLEGDPAGAGGSGEADPPAS